MIELIPLFPPYLAEAMCHAPNPFEFALIVSLVTATLVASTASGFAFVSIAVTLVELLVSGEGLGTIAMILSGDLSVAGVGMEVIYNLIYGIKNILGCG
jgi:hypothetical protein